jgi:radical SAM protein with 4Fe4S-binding SPASM domain
MHSIESTVQELMGWGIKKISFLRLVNQGYASKNFNALHLDSNNWEILNKIFLRIEERESINTKIRFGVPFSNIKNSKPLKCNAGHSKLIIRYDGVVLPCEAFKGTSDTNFIFGNIYQNKLADLLRTGQQCFALNNLKQLTSSIESCPAQLMCQTI